MSDASVDVTAIVISYNSEDRIVAAVEAHEKALAHLEYEILVVDNASSDASVTRAREAVRRGRVIANPENVGYGKAANIALAQARGKASMILNDDARLDAEAVDTLAGVLFSAPDVALVGPRIVDEEGNPMPSARMTFPGVREEMERIRGLLRAVDRNEDYPGDGDKPVEVAWLVAACVLGRTDLLRSVGGFNPAFFLYAEDIDLCRRLHEMGYRVLTVPNATCVHTGSVSTTATFGRTASSGRRTAARDLYYRIWQPRPLRSLVHLRRAFGVRSQPGRLLHHLPLVVWDGPSLRHLRHPPPLGSTPPESA